MDVCAILTVYFEDPFWVAVLERHTGGRVEAAKLTFGAEPKDYEVYEALLCGWHRLRFSPPVADDGKNCARPNPKRAQRQAAALLEGRGSSTKAQQALQLQREQNAQARKAQNRQRLEQEKERKFELRQQRKKEKRKGR